MKHLLLVLTILIAQALPAQAQSADEAAIQSVISDQISAFQVDDFAAAFDFASPSIRQIFGTSDQFGQMVITGYPMVHRPAKVDFVELRNVDGSLWQLVMVLDQRGGEHLLGYQMLRVMEQWKINAVRKFTLPPPSV